MLTDDEKARLRAEEIFRSSLRTELEARQKPTTLRSQLWRFLNSPFGGWFLGTVVVTVASLGFTLFLNWRNSEAIADQARRAADEAARVRTREDVQMVASLLPLLASEEPQLASGASAALTHLRKVGISEELASTITNILQGTEKKGTSPEATESQRSSAETSASIQDADTGSSQSPLEQVATTSVLCSRTEALLERRNSDPTWDKSPKRVYLHIASESQRGIAENLAEALRLQGYLAPGVENVGERSPRSTEIRFFNEEDAGLAAEVSSTIASATPEVQDITEPKCPPLYARKGHLEVFFSNNVAGISGEDHE